MCPGGYFVTQQVGDHTNRELRDLFGVDQVVETSWPHNAKDAEETFLDLGFDPVRFWDVGALVYYLKAVPWEVPGFGIAEHGETLLSLHSEVGTRGYAIDATYNTYLAIVRKR